MSEQFVSKIHAVSAASFKDTGAEQAVSPVVFVDADGNPVDIGGGGGDVTSVNGQTGAVVLAADDVGALPGTYTPPAPAWAAVTGKPAVIAAGDDAAEARTAIGAGTSSLALGTSASTAAAGNHAHAASAVTATAVSPGTATNVQGILEELAARIAALESAAG